MAKLQNDPKSVWVINLTENRCTISVGTGDKATTLKLKKSWVPQDLSLQAQRKTITKSPDFRRAIQMGLVREMETQEAVDLLNSNPEAVEEYNRILSEGSNSSVLLNKLVADTDVDNNKGSTPEELLVAKVFGDTPDETKAKTEIRILKNAKKLNDSGILALTKKAAELNYSGVIGLLEEYADKV
jgi:hypothetical protein